MIIKSFISSVVIRLRYKLPDKSTTSYDMLDFESDIENLQGKYVVIERHILQIQDILLQYL